VLYCDNIRGLAGLTTDGGFAEYMIADGRFLVPIPSNIPFEKAAPLMCAGATMYGAIKKANVPKGSSLGIVGLGGLGHIGVQFAKSLGYRVVAVDNRAEPLALVKSLRLKPDLVISASDPLEDAISQIHTFTAGPPTSYPGLDAVIIATDGPGTFAYGAKITRKHGTLVVVGQPNDGVKFDFRDLVFRDVHVVGSVLSTPEQAREMMDLVHKEGIEIVTKVYPLDKVNELVEDYHKPDMKGRFVVTLE